MRRKLAAAGMMMTIAAVAGPPAQAAPRIVIETPTHGASLVADVAHVTGYIEDLELSHSYRLEVQGYPTGIAPDGAFDTVIPMYPDSTGDPAPWFYPYRHWARSRLRVFRPVLVELHDTTTDVTTSPVYRRVLMHDLRVHNAQMLDVDDWLTSTAGYQLTPDGIYDVAGFLPDLFPLPLPGGLNDVIAEQLGNGRDVENSGFGRPCTAVTDFPKLLSTFQFAAISGSAIALIAYNNGQAAATGVPPYPALPLVFDPSDVKVCIKRVEGLIERVEVGEVSEIRLEPDSDQVYAQTVIEDVDANVDVTLVSFLRYRNGRYRWVLPPVLNQPLPDHAMFCGDQAFDADGAQSSPPVVTVAGTPITLEVFPHHEDPSLIDTAQTNTSVFSLIDPRLSLDGPCDTLFIRDEVQELVDSIENEIEDLLGDAWDHEVDGATQQSESLRYALTTFETADGEGAVVDYRTETELIDVNQPRALRLETGTDTVSYSTVMDRQERMFYVENGPLPEFSAVSPSPALTPYDLAITLSTGVLNQVLVAATPAGLLHFTPEQPTYADLGLCIPEVGHCWEDAAGLCICDAGATAKSGAAVLDGETLAWLLPELAAIGEQEVEIRFRPTLAPVVTMWQSEFHFHVGQFMVELVTPASGADDEILWMQAAVDIYDTRFGLQLGDADDMVDADIDLDRHDVTVLDHGLGTRPSRPAVALAMERMLRRFLLPALADALRQLPVPEFHDVPLLDYVPFTLDEQLDQFRSGQNITIFTDLEH